MKNMPLLPFYIPYAAIVILFLTLLTIPEKAFAWQKTIINYTQKDYAAGTQNWDIAIGHNGWIYAANNYGLLEFDGLRWELYGIQNGGTVRSVATNATNDTIWVGGDNEYGYFTPDEHGQLRYTSIAAETIALYGNFGSIWNIMQIGSDIFFQAHNHIFIHNTTGQLQHTIQSENSIIASVKMGNNIYIARSGGLFDITAHSLGHPIAELTTINTADICSLCAHTDSTLLIGTKSNGIFTYKPSQPLQQLSTPAHNYIQQHKLYNIKSNGKQIAYATITGGVVIEDATTQHIYIATTSNGLQNNTVLNLLFDGNNTLWCGLDIGIDRIDINSPLTELCNKQNTLGTGYAFLTCGNNTYIGTNRALYQTSNTPITDIEPTNCNIIDGSIGQVWGLYCINNTLFCCHDKGLYFIQSQKLVPICTNEGFWKIIPFTTDSTLAIAGSYNGLYIIKRTHNEYQATPLHGLSSSCKTFEIDQSGYVWITTEKGIERVSIDVTHNSISRELKMQRWAIDSYMNIMKLDGKIYISQGTHSFSVDNNGNISDSPQLLSKLLGSNVFYSDIKKDKNGNIWFVVGDALYALPASAPNSILQIWNAPRNNVYGFTNITPIEGNAAVVNTVGGFAIGSINNALTETKQKTPQCFIRQISSLIPQSNNTYYNTYTNTTTAIPYSDNSIRITFGSIECSNRYTEFSYALSLENQQPVFSDWTPNASKDYTFLTPGHYTFKLRMRLNNNNIAHEYTLHFEVLPPWWKTWWAYTLWCISTIITITGIVYVSHKRNEAKRQRIMQQNEEELLRLHDKHEKELLAAEKETLKAINEKIESELKNKSEELSNILLSNVSRNELIDKVKHDLIKVADDIAQKDNRGAVKRIAMMQDKLTSYMEEKVNWKQFEENYNEVNGLFLQKLQTRYPWISDNEKRLCVYIRMGLLNKEIAPLMSVSVRGVEMIRYRMRKKMELTRDDDIDELLKEFDTTSPQINTISIHKE